MKKDQKPNLPEYFYQPATLPRVPALHEDKGYSADFAKEREAFDIVREKYGTAEGAEAWVNSVDTSVIWTSKILHAIKHQTVKPEELETHPLVRAWGFIMAMLEDLEARPHASIVRQLDEIFPEAVQQGRQDWAAFKGRPELKSGRDLKQPFVN